MLELFFQISWKKCIPAQAVPSLMFWSEDCFSLLTSHCMQISTMQFTLTGTLMRSPGKKIELFSCIAGRVECGACFYSFASSALIHLKHLFSPINFSECCHHVTKDMIFVIVSWFLERPTLLFLNEFYSHSKMGSACFFLYSLCHRYWIQKTLKKRIIFDQLEGKLRDLEHCFVKFWLDICLAERLMWWIELWCCNKR